MSHLGDNLNQFILAHLPAIPQNMEWQLSAIQEYYVDAYRPLSFYTIRDNSLQIPEWTQFRIGFVAVPDYKREVTAIECQPTNNLLIIGP